MLRVDVKLFMIFVDFNIAILYRPSVDIIRKINQIHNTYTIRLRKVSTHICSIDENYIILSRKKTWFF